MSQILDFDSTPIWTFLADWEDGLLETLQSKTAILQSPTGATQRLRTRIAPRRYFDINFKVFFNERGYFDMIMAARSGAEWLVPVAYDVEVLTVDQPAGTQQFYMDTTYREFVEGDYVLFRGPTCLDFEVRKIDSVQETFMTTTAPLLQTWKKGTRLYPLIRAVIDPQTPPTWTRKSGDVWQGTVRFLSTQPYDWPIGTNQNMLINASGLVVNAYHYQAGRGNYFNQASGTSEGQLILFLGLLGAAVRGVNTTKAQGLYTRLINAVDEFCYRGQTVPTAVDVTHTYAPHWLFITKKPVKACVVRYDVLVNFVNGVGTFQDDERGATRYIFQVVTSDFQLLWKNPYSPLINGLSLAVNTVEYDPATEKTTITLENTALTNSYYVIHSAEMGNRLEINQLYEAWPDWRPLDEGEVDCAADTMAWMFRGWQQLYSVTQDPVHLAKAQATLQQAAIVYDVNDSRDWLKPTYTGNPFAIGSRYEFSTRGAPAKIQTDGAGNVTIRVGSGGGEVQYGNASVKDVYHDTDITQVTIGSNVPMQVTIFIDPYQQYSEPVRYRCTLSLAGTGLQQFNLTRNNFLNDGGQVIPAESPVYTVGVSDTWGPGHTITIARVRQLPHLDVLYYPGPIPFTANFLGSPATLIDWRGPIYTGYQSPWMWYQIGNTTALTNCLQMLHDAQDQWTIQTGQTGQRGPFAPVFYFNRQDAVQYGVPNTFGWIGPDPNTEWGGYQYRPLADCAELYNLCDIQNVPYGATLAGILTDFLSWLDTNWQVGNGPPTIYPQSAAQTTYLEPHFAALIMRAAMYVKLKLHSLNLTVPTYLGSLIDKAFALLTQMYVTTGRMGGTFCSSPDTTQEWYGFWHGEILRSLCLFLDYSATFPAADRVTQATAWMSGMIDWAQANALPPDTTPYIGNFPVLTLPIDEADDQTYGYTRLQNIVDTDTGIPIVQDTANRGFSNQTASWTQIGRQQHSALKDMIFGFKGQQKPFWVPTYQNDIQFAAWPLAAGQSNFAIRNIGYTRWGQNNPDRQYIILALKNGTTYTLHITGAALVTTAIENIVCDTGLPVAIEQKQLRYCYFATLSMLNSDTVEITHVTDNKGVCTCQLSFIAAPDIRVAPIIPLATFANNIQTAGLCSDPTPPTLGHDLDDIQIVAILPDGTYAIGWNVDGTPIRGRMSDDPNNPYGYPGGKDPNQPFDVAL